MTWRPELVPLRTPAPFQCARPVVRLHPRPSRCPSPPPPALRPPPSPLPRSLSPRRQLLPACVTLSSGGLTCQSQGPITWRHCPRADLADPEFSLHLRVSDAQRSGVETAPGWSGGMPTAGDGASWSQRLPPHAHWASSVPLWTLPGLTGTQRGLPLRPVPEELASLRGDFASRVGALGGRGQPRHPALEVETAGFPQPGKLRQMVTFHLWVGQRCARQAPKDE